MRNGGITSVVKVLASNTSLTKLDLSSDNKKRWRLFSKKRTNKETGNGIGTEGGVELSEALKVNSSLIILNLNSVKQRIVKKMKWNNRNKIDNKLGDEGVSRLSESLKVNTTLTDLYLNDNATWHHTPFSSRSKKFFLNRHWNWSRRNR